MVIGAQNPPLKPVPSGPDFPALVNTPNIPSTPSPTPPTSPYYGSASGEDDWSILETCDGSDNTLKQQVWGLRYIDELVQIAMNDDPADTGEQNCADGTSPGPDAHPARPGPTEKGAHHARVIVDVPFSAPGGTNLRSLQVCKR